MNRVLAVSAGLFLALATGPISAASAQTVPAQDMIDRSATLRYVYTSAPAAYDPPMAKNQFQETSFTFPIYDSLIRLDTKGNIVPDLATSWSFSSDGLTLTMQLRKGVKFTDGSDVTADAVVKSLTRTKKNPASTLAGQLRSFDTFEAKDSSTVILRLNTPDANVLYPLATSAGMIVSAKAIDDAVDLSTKPVGSGPYKLVSSGPQGATYERNEDYFDKSQSQFAKAAITAITDVTARLNAVLTGQADIGMFQVDQWPQIEAMVKSGKFTVHRFLSANSLPVWLNTKIKPLDNPKVRMALNLAINRDAINSGIQNGQCQPAAQPIPPGVIGHDERLEPYKQNIEKAKELLKEAGVGPFSFDALAQVQEPIASFAVAIKAQLQVIGVTMNVIPTGSPAVRPLFRAGNHGAMIQNLSVPAPDPASIIDAVYMGPDNPGGVTPEFAKAVTDARTKPIGNPDREAAYKAISRMAYDDPRQILTCWPPTLIVARKGVAGIENTAYLNAAAIPDIRSYSILKNPN